MPSTPGQTPTPVQSPNRLAPLQINRPRVRIQIPSPIPQGQYLDARSPYTAQTQGSNGAPQWPSSPYVNPFSPNDKESMNAGEYIFKQFSGIKDFTVDWTKSGLNHGERSVFLVYDVISKWSRKWFTHIFLLTIVFLYSVLGAWIFVHVEGNTHAHNFLFFFFSFFPFVINNKTIPLTTTIYLYCVTNFYLNLEPLLY